MCLKLCLIHEGDTGRCLCAGIREEKPDTLVYWACVLLSSALCHQFPLPRLPAHSQRSSENVECRYRTGTLGGGLLFGQGN